MYLIREHLFGLKKVVKAKPHEEQGRVVVYDQLQVRGDILKSLPSQFGSDYSTALIAVPVKHVTTFTIAIGSLRIAMDSNMVLRPNLIIFNEIQDTDHDCTLSLITSNGKYMYIRAPSKEIYEKWHLALREALAELIFTGSFVRISDGSLSIRKIEMAIQKCNLLVPSANCHMLRAKKLLSIKLELKQMIQRLTQNPQSFSREEVQQFLKRADCDRLLLKDSQMLTVKSLEPKLFTREELEAISAPISHNASASSIYTTDATSQSIAASLKDLQPSAMSSARKAALLESLTSPIKNSFQRSLAEVSLATASVKKRRNGANSSSAMKNRLNNGRGNSTLSSSVAKARKAKFDFSQYKMGPHFTPPASHTFTSNAELNAYYESCEEYNACLALAMIDDSDVNQLFAQSIWTASPDLTPLRELGLQARREKRRRNRVLKFQSGTPQQSMTVMATSQMPPSAGVRTSCPFGARPTPAQFSRDNKEGAGERQHSSTYTPQETDARSHAEMMLSEETASTPTVTVGACPSGDSTEVLFGSDMPAARSAVKASPVTVAAPAHYTPQSHVKRHGQMVTNSTAVTPSLVITPAKLCQVVSPSGDDDLVSVMTANTVNTLWTAASSAQAQEHTLTEVIDLITGLSQGVEMISHKSAQKTSAEKARRLQQDAQWTKENLPGILHTYSESHRYLLHEKQQQRQLRKRKQGRQQQTRMRTRRQLMPTSGESDCGDNEAEEEDGCSEGSELDGSNSDGNSCADSSSRDGESSGSGNDCESDSDSGVSEATGYRQQQEGVSAIGNGDNTHRPVDVSPTSREMLSSAAQRPYGRYIHYGGTSPAVTTAAISPSLLQSHSQVHSLSRFQQSGGFQDMVLSAKKRQLSLRQQSLAVSSHRSVRVSPMIQRHRSAVVAAVSSTNAATAPVGTPVSGNVGVSEASTSSPPLRVDLSLFGEGESAEKCTPQASAAHTVQEAPDMSEPQQQQQQQQFYRGTERRLPLSAISANSPPRSPLRSYLHPSESAQKANKLNSKAYQKVTSLLNRADTPVRVEDDGHCVSHFSMKPPGTVEDANGADLKTQPPDENKASAGSNAHHNSRNLQKQSQHTNKQSHHSHAQTAATPSDVLLDELTTLYKPVSTLSTSESEGDQTVNSAATRASRQSQKQHLRRLQEHAADEDKISALFSELIFDGHLPDTEDAIVETGSTSAVGTEHVVTISAVKMESDAAEAPLTPMVVSHKDNGATSTTPDNSLSIPPSHRRPHSHNVVPAPVPLTPILEASVEYYIQEEEGNSSGDLTPCHSCDSFDGTTPVHSRSHSSSNSFVNNSSINNDTSNSAYSAGSHNMSHDVAVEMMVVDSPNHSNGDSESSYTDTMNSSSSHSGGRNNRSVSFCFTPEDSTALSREQLVYENEDEDEEHEDGSITYSDLSSSSGDSSVSSSPTSARGKGIVYSDLTSRFGDSGGKMADKWSSSYDKRKGFKRNSVLSVIGLCLLLPLAIFIASLYHQSATGDEVPSTQFHSPKGVVDTSIAAPDVPPVITVESYEPAVKSEYIELKQGQQQWTPGDVPPTAGLRRIVIPGGEYQPFSAATESAAVVVVADADRDKVTQADVAISERDRSAASRALVEGLTAGQQIDARTIVRINIVYKRPVKLGVAVRTFKNKLHAAVGTVLRRLGDTLKVGARALFGFVTVMPKEQREVVFQD